MCLQRLIVFFAIFFLVTQLAMFSPAILLAMPVAQAYKAIPHRQTTYALAKSNLPSTKAKEIERFFTLVDEAVALRVETLVWFQSSGRRGKGYQHYSSRIERVLARISVLNLSKEAQFAQQLVMSAIKKQQNFFSLWDVQLRSKRGTAPNMKSNRMVRESSQELRRAYRHLMQKFASESAVNKQAFFDHLCALDFI